nr:hypothetical protein [Tanacetum cinerariifolium]
MEAKDIELQNNSYSTALTFAASVGNINTAMIMINKNPAVLEIPGSSGTMPIYMAALNSKPDLVRYLYSISNKMSGDLWTDQTRGWVLQRFVEANIFGNAEKESQALKFLRTIWQKIAIFPKTDIDVIFRGPPVQKGDVTTYPLRVFFAGAKMGNTRFIIELIQLYPDLVWQLNDKEQTIFHIAVKCRHENIYNLLYEIGSMKALITRTKDRKRNTLLHFAAKGKLSQNVSGVALQMQRQLLWFKVHLSL